MNSHILKLTLDSQPPRPDGLNTIYVRYQNGKLLKRKKSDYAILKKDWDSKKCFIKDDKIQEYKELAKNLTDIKKRFIDLITALRGKTITYVAAFDKALNIGSNGYKLNEFIKTNSIITKKDKLKYQERIEGLENYLPKKYTPLTTDILGDEIAVKKIAQIMKEESGYTNNTIREYMYNLDRCGRLAGNINQDLFKKLNLKPKGDPPNPKGVEFDALMEGINDIRTLEDLEAYLFWLYSFCLLGLDFNDIINIDESCIAYDKSNDHYHPEAEINSIRYMNTKVHVMFRRKKSKIPMVLLINLFPILYIRDWLHHIVKITRPQYAYRGKDRFRIFNFKTINTNGNDDMESVKKKNRIASTYRVKTNRMFGSTLQKSRHSVTGQGGEIGMSQDDMNIQLGHSIKGVLKHYLKTSQISKDVNHTHIIQEFGILKILLVLRNKFMASIEPYPHGELRNMDRTEHKKRKQLVEVNWWPLLTIEEIKKLPPKEQKEFRKRFDELILLQEGILSLWSRDDQMKYDRLMEKASKGEWQIIDGVNKKVSLTDDEYPDELKQLITKKYSLHRKQNIKELKKFIKKMDGTWISPEVDKIIRDSELKRLKELEEGSKKRVTKSYP